MSIVGNKAIGCAAMLRVRHHRDLVLEMVERVIVGNDTISIALNEKRLRVLLAPSLALQDDGGSLHAKPPSLIRREFRLKRCGHGKKLIIGQDTQRGASQPDPSLVKAIARAHAWFEDLKSGSSYKEIALRDLIDERLVARTTRLAFLAPDIARAILSGREPNGLTSQTLIRIPHLPADWDAQRTLLGFN